MGWEATPVSSEEWKQFFHLMAKINGHYETEEEQLAGVKRMAKIYNGRLCLNEFLYCVQPETREPESEEPERQEEPKGSNPIIWVKKGIFAQVKNRAKIICVKPSGLLVESCGKPGECKLVHKSDIIGVELVDDENESHSIFWGMDY